MSGRCADGCAICSDEPLNMGRDPMEMVRVLADDLEDGVAIDVGLDEDGVLHIKQGLDLVCLPASLWTAFVMEMGPVVSLAEAMASRRLAAGGRA